MWFKYVIVRGFGTRPQVLYVMYVKNIAYYKVYNTSSSLKTIIISLTEGCRYTEWICFQAYRGH